jgi:hypothetical protein
LRRWRGTTLAPYRRCRSGYRSARVEVGAAVPSHAVDVVLGALRVEGFRLTGVVRGFEFVDRALHGERFTVSL